MYKNSGLPQWCKLCIFYASNIRKRRANTRYAEFPYRER